MRLISAPDQSLIETGMSGGENFSPKVGAKGSNSEVKSSVMTPVKCAAACADVKTQNFASAAAWSISVTSLRSQSGRVAPANGATSPDFGKRLMKSGTTRSCPAQGQNSSTLPVSASVFGKVVLPRAFVGFCGLLALYAAAISAWSGRMKI